MQKEHTLPSGEIIEISDESKYKTPPKPWYVACYTADGEECRWQVWFATQAEAEKEYVRFDQ